MSLEARPPAAGRCCRSGRAPPRCFRWMCCACWAAARRPPPPSCASAPPGWPQQPQRGSRRRGAAAPGRRCSRRAQLCRAASPAWRSGWKWRRLRLPARRPRWRRASWPLPWPACLWEVSWATTVRLGGRSRRVGLERSSCCLAPSPCRQVVQPRRSSECHGVSGCGNRRPFTARFPLPAVLLAEHTAWSGEEEHALLALEWCREHLGAEGTSSSSIGPQTAAQAQLHTAMVLSGADRSLPQPRARY